MPVTLNLARRNVLLIGSGDEARDKADKLLAAAARLTLVAPTACPGLAQRAARGELVWFARDFCASDVCGAQMVMLTDVCEARARELSSLKRAHGYLLCTLDQPDYSDVFLVSTVVRGPVQIGISTGGGAPLLARRIRRALEAGLDEEFSDFARRFADLRSSIRDLPKMERRERLERALDAFAMEVRVSYPAQIE